MAVAIHNNNNKVFWNAGGWIDEEKDVTFMCYNEIPYILNNGKEFTSNEDLFFFANMQRLLMNDKMIFDEQYKPFKIDENFQRFLLNNADVAPAVAGNIAKKELEVFQRFAIKVGQQVTFVLEMEEMRKNKEAEERIRAQQLELERFTVAQHYAQYYDHNVYTREYTYTRYHGGQQIENPRMIQQGQMPLQPQNNYPNYEQQYYPAIQ